MTAGDEALLLPDGYWDLRISLISYLRRLGSKSAEEHADEAVLRVLEKHRAGADIRDFRAYTLGVAHHVFLESAREPTLVELPDHLASGPASDSESRDKCLTMCLKRLPAKDRRIVKLYYSGSGQELIENRRKLAEELGLTLDALRIRALRIRKGLRPCIGECTERHKEE